MTIVFLSCEQAERIVTTSDGVDLYVEVRGEGKPCLFLHGGPGSGSYSLRKYYGDVLEERFTMVYLDQRGVSRSSSPKSSDYTLARQIQDFEEVRTALGYDKWFLLGHSFGGVLEMGYVEEHSEAIEGMMFVNCTLCMESSLADSWLPAATDILGPKAPKQLTDTTLTTLERLAIASQALGNERWRLFYDSKTLSDEFDSAYTDIPNWNNDGGNAMIGEKSYWRDFRPASAAVAQPVLFFYGERDYAIGPQHYMGVRFPNMKLVGCDVKHFSFVEAREELTEAIDAFMNEL